MSKWTRSKHPGIRFREHPSRRHGANPDRYYSIYLRVDGKLKEWGLGWASQGMNEARAVALMGEFKRAAITGEGPRDLDEKREQVAAQREAEAAEQERLAREGLTFGDFWKDTYFPQSVADKSVRTWKHEESFFKVWIGPVVAKVALRKVSPLHLEKIKSNMAKSGLAPRTIAYCLAVVRQVFNRARRLGYYEGEPPTKDVKRPTEDNRRLRFLTKQEASDLLAALAVASHDLAQQALLSLHTGMRAGEVFSLTWGDVDLDNNVLTLRDTKSGRNRHAHLTEATAAMLASRTRGGPADLVFPPVRRRRKIDEQLGVEPREQVSKKFSEVVESLGLNAGIKDRRQAVTFHTLRHTYASWLVMEGVPLYTVQRLLGHQSSALTERYSHLAPDHMAEAVKKLDAPGLPPKEKRQPPTYDTGPVVKRRRRAPSYDE